DGAFHELCDELLPRVDSRYRLLRPHGVNPDGRSIKGQPDSFIGESASDASVAFCYSTQKQAWWKKLVDDVNEARATCPNAREIVCATCNDTERDQRKPSDWFAQAKTASGTVALRLFTGREIAHLLDTDYQDLRFDYLRIPYSRLTFNSLVVASQQRTLSAVAEFVRIGRYDPNRYVLRSADRRLYDLWQSCWRSTASEIRPRLIPIVN